MQAKLRCGVVSVFKTIVIDTIDILYRLCAEHICQKRDVITGVSFDNTFANKDRNLLLVRINYCVIQSQAEVIFAYPFYRK